MNPIAILFPGQGSQFKGMLSEMAHPYRAIIEPIFTAASQHLGYDVWDLIQQDPEDKLGQTEFTQPALLTASVALWYIWKEMKGAFPSYLAGHSLGEYTALVCAGSIDFLEALILVANRGRFMQEAVQPGKGAMAAIIGLEDETVEKLCHIASQGQILSPANFNALGQVVVSGENAAVERLIVLAEEQGARMAKKIPVSVPSHCELMRPAAMKLKALLDTTLIHPPLIPIVFNVDAQLHEKPDAIRSALVKQLYSPVQWVKIIQFLNFEDMKIMVECGPGKVLSGLNKRIVKSSQTLSIDTPETLKQTIERLSLGGVFN